MADIERKEKFPPPPEGVEIIPEEFPEEVERKDGVKVVRSQITAKVTDDSGKPLITSPVTKTVSITIPADDQKLTSLSRGSTNDAITWFAMFWLRMIKKAIHFGWKILKKDSSE